MNNATSTRVLGRAGQSLADGQVATTAGTILSSSNLYTQIQSAIFFNTNITTQTLNIYITRSGGTRRQIHQQSLAQNASYRLLDNAEVISLSPGDVLEAATTTASAVDYVITGVTESIR